MFRRFRNYPQIGGKKLPYDAEVEWIATSSYGPFINTGIRSKANRDEFEIKVVCKYDKESFVNQRGIMGLDNGRWVGIAKGPIYDLSNNVRYNLSTVVTLRTTLDKYGNYAMYHNEILHKSGVTTSTYEGYCFLFRISMATGNDDNYGIGDTTIYEALIKSNETTVNLIPVRFTNEQGVSEGAMYDKVSGKLFRNQGTGAFIIGPDKDAWVNPYITDGLIAMWDGEWNAGGGVHDELTRAVNLVTNSNEISFSHFDGKKMVFNKNISSPNIPEIVAAFNAKNYSVEVAFDNGTANNDWNNLLMCGSGALFRPNYRSDRNYCYSLGYGVSAVNSISKTVKSICVYCGDGKIDMIVDSLSLGIKDVITGAASGDLYVGMDSTRNEAVAYSGKLMSLRIYNRKLTALESAANYVIDKARFGLT